ncbi:MAG: class I SAM-dependent methyltransferase, partial [Planctomycetota bacterium]
MTENEESQDRYALRAGTWDCFFGDRTEEIHFVATLAKYHGNRILAPMAATGEVARNLAERGFEVFAFDRCEAMVRTATENAAGVASFTAIQGDLTTLRMERRDFDFAFLGTGDLHHFLDLPSAVSALKTLSHHTSAESGLLLELFNPPLPQDTPRPPKPPATRRFDAPRPHPETGGKVWKESQTRYDPEDRRLTIAQTQHASGPGAPTPLTYTVHLRLFTREELLDCLDQAGYEIASEYGSYRFSPWTEQSPRWLVLARKKRRPRVPPPVLALAFTTVLALFPSCAKNPNPETGVPPPSADVVALYDPAENDLCIIHD